jgi:membrane protease subunit HflK
VPWNVPGGSGDKDPWGQGGRSNQGPPDLDEIVRKIQNKLGGIFGGKGGGRSGGNGAGGGIGAGIIIVILLGVWLLTGFYIVQQGERGVVLRFGKKAEVTTAGLRWHLPWPVERVEKVNVEEVSVIEIGYRTNLRTAAKTKVAREAVMLTQDENIIDIEFAVQYRVSDASDFLFNVRDPRGTIFQATESAIREIAGKNTMDFILTGGREEIGQKTRAVLQEILDRYKAGILITQLRVQGAQPPAEVKAAFDDAVKAREDEQRIKNEAEAYSNDILPRARGGSARLLSEAEGYKASVIARAEGDARRFSAIAREYAKAPRVTRDRLYLETIEQILSKSTKVFVDQKGGNNLLYLPLDKLMQRAVEEVKPSRDGIAESATPEQQPSIRDRLRERAPARRVP